MTGLQIGSHPIGDDQATYFIADVSANHDGDLERAKALIWLAARAGADAAKFQNFRAAHIVSAHGFAALGRQLSHQATWKKSVTQVYEEASLPWDWTPLLKAECEAAGIEYMSTPYDFEAVDMLDPYLRAFKIGSGDITWLEMLRKVAGKGKPVLLATGASDLKDVVRAVDTLQALNGQLVLMQCNTNYTASEENFRHIHLNVLKAYRLMFPDVALGLSDHTAGHTAVLGAVALGARIIEKHFTDDTTREGPDHPFSMTPQSWREMVARTRELELALGSAVKRIADNERETAVVQRRAVRAAIDLEPGTTLVRESLAVLRPAPVGAIAPYEIERVLGCRLKHRVCAGQALRWSMLEENA